MAILAIAGPYAGLWTGGSANDTLRFAANADISGINSGAETTFGMVDFDDVARAVAMTTIQHNGFVRPFLATAGAQTITLATDGVATGDAGMEQYVLGQDGTHANVFTVGAIAQGVIGGDDDDIVIDDLGGLSGVLLGGTNSEAGDTLILGAANTELAPGSGQFENLRLARDATVSMTPLTYRDFSGRIDAPGDNTIVISGEGSGFDGAATTADVENYVLLDGAGDYTFSIAGSHQSVTDGGTIGSNTANIAGGLSHVTLQTAAAGREVVNALFGDDHLSVVSGGGSIALVLAGGHTDIRFVGSASGDRVEVSGVVTGVLDGGSQADSDVLTLDDTADIDGVTVTNFEGLSIAADAAVALSAATWDQFVQPDGTGIVSGTTGIETLTFTTTTVDTTAFTGTGIDIVENYVLASAGNDFFTINQRVGGVTYNTQVTLTAGGSDVLTFSYQAQAPPGVDVNANVIGFTSGSGAGFDIVAVEVNGAPVSNAGFLRITAANTDVDSQAVQTVFSVAASVATIAGAWDLTKARTALDMAIGKIDPGLYTAVLDNGAGTDVMAMKIVTADTLTDAHIDLVGMLQDVDVATLVSANFG